ncbi:MAG: Maf family protein, partial [Limisphaerales bacterium]
SNWSTGDRLPLYWKVKKNRMALAQVLTEIPHEKEWRKVATRLAGRKVVLASASPRRKFLFAQLEIPFIVFPSEVEEEDGIVESSNPAGLAAGLAERKAADVLKKSGGDIVIGADTIVVLGKKVFGKPRTKKEAFEFLSELQGRKHAVYTGLSVFSASGKRAGGAEKTEVFFYEVGSEPIRAYIQAGEGMDKAGAYGIQGMGSFLVEKINGPLDNVVGLPRLKLLALMKKVI